MNGRIGNDRESATSLSQGTLSLTNNIALVLDHRPISHLTIVILDITAIGTAIEAMETTDTMAARASFSPTVMDTVTVVSMDRDGDSETPTTAITFTEMVGMDTEVILIDLSVGGLAVGDSVRSSTTVAI